MATSDLTRTSSNADSAQPHDPRAGQRAFCVACGPDADEPSLAELRELLATAGVSVVGVMAQRRAEPDPDRYLGRGKIEELKAAAAASDANLIACDDELRPRQERNLEDAVGLPVLDRTAVILDIFASHATTAEGKLQVELAQLQYNLARMRGLWTHLERLGGGLGTRGPGESQIETDRRLARNRITQLKRRLERQRRRRLVMRAERGRAGLPNVALAGYTNAGKSTLMNALTDAGVAVRSRLFETLDPTTRTFEIDGRRFLLTDTVGFIRKLPHQLVEAFHATLEQMAEADVVIHVVDASDAEEDRSKRIEAVEDTLEAIGAGPIERILVFNKVDLLSPAERRRLRNANRDAALVSAAAGEGLDDLRRRIARAALAGLRRADLLIPFDRGDVLSELHEIAGDLERTETADGVRVVARLRDRHLERFRAFAVRASRDPVA